MAEGYGGTVEFVTDVPSPGVPAPTELAPPVEHHHRNVERRRGAASVFGVSDGLVSNVSLILGVAGAGTTASASCAPQASPASSPARSRWPRASTCR